MTALLTGLGAAVLRLWNRFGDTGDSRYIHVGASLLRRASDWSASVTLATGIGSEPVSAVNMVDGEGRVLAYFSNTTGLGRLKDDGATSTTWGLPAPANPPSAAVLATDLSTTIDAMDASGNWTVTSGLSAGPTNEPNIKQLGAQSQTITVAAATLGLLAKSLGGTTNLDTLTGGDATVKADDYIHLWVRADRPDRISYLQMDIDIEQTTVASAFRTNYYSVRLPSLVWLNQGADQWSQVQVPKSAFQRFGSNTATSWATAESVRLSVLTTGDGAVQLYLDDWKLRGGTDLVGEVRYTICYRNSTTGGRGNPPLDSDDQPRYTTPLVVDRQRVTITTSNIMQGGADHPGDTQLNQYRLYRSINAGDALQIAELADTTASPYTDSVSVASLLVARSLETDNHVPPNAHIVFGPGNQNRLFAVFGQNDLGYSKAWENHENRAENWPPTYRTKVGDGSEQLMTGLVSDTAVLVWTTEQAYSVQGVGADTFLAVPIPNSRGVVSRLGATEGDGRVFLVAHDGVYQQQGGRQELLTATIAPFFQGVTMAGQAGWNTTASVLSQVQLVWQTDPIAPFLLMLYAEADSSVVNRELYLGRDPVTGRYDQLSFDQRSGTTLRSLLHDPEQNILLAGTADGGVMHLEDATVATDDGEAIAWEIVSASENHEAPAHEFFIAQVLLELSAPGSLVTVAALTDRQATEEVLSTTVSTAASTDLVALVPSDPEAFHADMGLRLSGTLTARVDVHQYGWLWEAGPELLTFWDSGILDLGFQTNFVSLFYTIRAAANVSAAVRLDAQSERTYTILGTGGARVATRLFFLPGTRGRVVRVVLSSPAPFRVYQLFLKGKPYGSAAGARDVPLLAAR